MLMKSLMCDSHLFFFLTAEADVEPGSPQDYVNIRVQLLQCQKTWIPTADGTRCLALAAVIISSICSML